MNELVSDAGVNHSHQEVFSGGASGTPSALWNNAKKRKEAQKILDGGDIDLFGMPVDAMDGGGKMTTEFYEKWINYARTKNPDTIVMIGLPWLSYPSDFDTATYTSKMRSSAATFWPSVLDSLRAKYPGVTIIDNPYGLGLVEARLLFEAGGLPDVDKLFGGCDEDVTGENPCGDNLFNDHRGHCGIFGRKLTALMWLNRIYKVDLSAYSSAWLSNSRQDRLAGRTFETNITAVAKAVLDKYDVGNLCGTSPCYTGNDTGPLISKRTGSGFPMSLPSPIAVAAVFLVAAAAVPW